MVFPATFFVRTLIQQGFWRVWGKLQWNYKINNLHNSTNQKLIGQKVKVDKNMMPLQVIGRRFKACIDHKMIPHQMRSHDEWYHEEVPKKEENDIMQLKKRKEKIPQVSLHLNKAYIDLKIMYDQMQEITSSWQQRIGGPGQAYKFSLIKYSYLRIYRRVLMFSNSELFFLLSMFFLSLSLSLSERREEKRREDTTLLSLSLLSPNWQQDQILSF